MSGENLQLVSLEKGWIQNRAAHSHQPCLAWVMAQSCLVLRKGSQSHGQSWVKKTEILGGEQEGETQWISSHRVDREKEVQCMMCTAMTTSCVIGSTDPTCDWQELWLFFPFVTCAHSKFSSEAKMKKSAAVFQNSLITGRQHHKQDIVVNLALCWKRFQGWHV